MAATALSAAAFTEQAAASLRAEGLDVTVLGELLLEVELDAERVAQLRLHPLLALAQRPELGGVPLALERLVSTVRAQRRPTLDPFLVVPLVRTTAQLAGLLAEDPQLPSVSIGGGLWAVFMFELAEHFRQVRRRDADLMRLTDERLLERACENLARRPAPELRGDGPVWRVVLDGELDASVLLLDAVWERWADVLGPEPLALALSPGVLLCGRGAAGRADLDGVARARRPVGGGPVLPVLQRRGGDWVPLGG